MDEDEKMAKGSLWRDALTQESLRVMLAIGKLSEMLSAKARPAEIEAGLSHLIELVTEHFLHEEELMDEEGYAGRAWHKIVHRDILDDLKLAACHTDGPSPAIDKSFLTKIRSIFIQHSDDDDIFKARAKFDLLTEALAEVHPADLADVLEELGPEERFTVFNQLDTEQASDTLEEIEPPVQRALVSSLSVERVAELVDEMTPAQAADLLAVLNESERTAILQRIAAAKAAKIRALVERRAANILSFTTLRYIGMPPTATIGEVTGRYRSLAENAAVPMYIYVIGPNGILLGVIDCKAILAANLSDKLSEVMTGRFVSLAEGDTLATAAQLFGHYGFAALPVVDSDSILKGVVPARDLMQLTLRQD